MRGNKCWDDVVFCLQHKSVGLEPINPITKLNKVEYALFTGLERAQFTSDYSLNDLLKLSEFFAFELSPLFSEKLKAGPSAVFLRDASLSACRSRGVKIKPKPSPAARPNVLRNYSLAERVHFEPNLGALNQKLGGCYLNSNSSIKLSA
jgi:hypothetical protein